MEKVCYRWYNFDTPFASIRDALRTLLKKSHITYEISSAYSCYHFEIYCNEHDAVKINKWLNENCN